MNVCIICKLKWRVRETVVYCQLPSKVGHRKNQLGIIVVFNYLSHILHLLTFYAIDITGFLLQVVMSEEINFVLMAIKVSK